MNNELIEKEKSLKATLQSNRNFEATNNYLKEEISKLNDEYKRDIYFEKFKEINAKYDELLTKFQEEENKAAMYKDKLEKVEASDKYKDKEFCDFKKEIGLLECELTKISSSNEMLKNFNNNLKTEIEFLKSDNSAAFKEKENEYKKEIKTLRNENKIHANEIKLLNKQIETIAATTNNKKNNLPKAKSRGIPSTSDYENILSDKNIKCSELEQTNYELIKRVTDIEVFNYITFF